jgi:glutathione S-transferase
LRADVARLCGLWGELLSTQPRLPNGQQPFLFGEFGIADAYFAPVCMRIHTYGLPMPADMLAYVERVREAPGVKAWMVEALQEHDFLDFEEPYRLGR